MSTINKEKGIFNKLITNALTIGGEVVTGISHTLDSKKSGSLASTTLITNLMEKIERTFIKKESLDSTLISEMAMSSNLISVNLSTSEESQKDGLIVKGFDNVSGKLIWNKEIINLIRIPNDLIRFTGKYLLVGHIGNIRNTHLMIKDNKNNQYLVKDTTGSFEVELNCDNTNSCYFDLSIIGIDDGTEFTLDSLKMFKLRDNLLNYLIGKIEKEVLHQIGETSITKDYLKEYIAQVLDTRLEDMQHIVGTIGNTLAEHLKTKNAHGVTLENLNGATKDHKHTPKDIGAADEEHSHTLKDLHAASDNHKHKPEDIGAADRIHPHDEYVAKDDPIIKSNIRPNILVNTNTVPSTNWNKLHTPIPVNMLTKTLNHFADGYRDITSGSISSNRLTVNDIWEGVQDKYMLFAEGNTFSTTIINYAFIVPRYLNSLTLCISLEKSFKPFNKLKVIYDGQQISEEELTWNENRTIIYLKDNIPVNRLSIEIAEASLTNCTWGLNMDIEYNDTLDKDIKISNELLYTYEKDGYPIIAGIEDGIYLDLDDYVPNHPYLIGLQYDEIEERSRCRVVPHPANFTECLDGKELLLNKYTKTTSLPYYGSIGIFKKDVGGNACLDKEKMNIYSDTSDSMVTYSGSNDIRIKHYFGTNDLVVNMMSFLFKKDELANIPTIVKVGTINRDGTETILNELVDINIDINVDDYVELIIFQQTKQLNNFFIDCSNDSHIIINQLKIFFDTNQYDIHNYNWIKGDPITYIGMATKIDDKIHIASIGTGDKTLVPINSGNTCKSGREFSVLNPFSTKDIKMAIIDITYNPKTGSNKPEAVITNMDDMFITVTISKKGRFALEIERNW